MHGIPAYIKKQKKKRFTDPHKILLLISYSDFCLYISYNNEKNQKIKQNKKAFRKMQSHTFLRTHIMVDSPFSKRGFFLQIPYKSLLSA